MLDSTAGLPTVKSAWALVEVCDKPPTSWHPLPAGSHGAVFHQKILQEMKVLVSPSPGLALYSLFLDARCYLPVSVAWVSWAHKEAKTRHVCYPKCVKASIPNNVLTAAAHRDVP